MPYKDKPTEKVHWYIGEVAAMLGVKTSCIRYWEREFKIIVPKKGNGRRYYSKKYLEKLKTIHYLVKIKKYKIDGAKEIINNKTVMSAQKLKHNNLSMDLIELFSLPGELTKETKQAIIRKSEALEKRIDNEIETTAKVARQAVKDEALLKNRVEKLEVRIKELKWELDVVSKEWEELEGLQQPINIIFDGPPSHESGRFIEAETDEGESINVGEWIERPDNLWALRITSLKAKPSTGGR